MHRISWYPAIVPAPGCSVFGELFDVTEETLKVLDDVEDRGILYERHIERIQLLGSISEEKGFSQKDVGLSSPGRNLLDANRGDMASAFVYVYMHALQDNVIESGRFE